MLVRVVKAGAAFESRTPQELLDSVFTREGKPDLEISVYEIEGNQLVRIVAEHMASAGLDPTPKDHHLDLQELVDQQGIATKPSPDSEWFQLARDTHHVLCFQTEDELRRFVQSVHEQLGRLRVTADRRSVLAYVATRITNRDAEWDRFFAEAPKGPKWRDRVMRKAGRPSG